MEQSKFDEHPPLSRHKNTDEWIDLNLAPRINYVIVLVEKKLPKKEKQATNKHKIKTSQ